MGELLVLPIYANLPTDMQVSLVACGACGVWVGAEKLTEVLLGGFNHGHICC